MAEKKRIIPLDKLIDYPSGRYKAAVLAIKAIQGVSESEEYYELSKTYTKVAGYALYKVLTGEVEEEQM